MIKRPVVTSRFLLSAISLVLCTINANANSLQDDTQSLIGAAHSRVSGEVNTATDASSNIDGDTSNSKHGNEQDKASLRALLAQFTTLKATFAQKIIDLQGEVLQSASGELFLQKPQMLRWSVTEPEESLLIADGNSVYNVDPFLEQVTILDQAALTQSNPLMLLVSDEQSQWEQVGVSKQENTFTIISLQANSPISKLILRFDPQNQLVSLESYDRQQQANLLNFSDVVLNQGVSVKDFTYTANDSWVIDDQRKTLKP